MIGCIVMMSYPSFVAQGVFCAVSSSALVIQLTQWCNQCIVQQSMHPALIVCMRDVRALAAVDDNVHIPSSALQDGHHNGHSFKHLRLGSKLVVWIMQRGIIESRALRKFNPALYGLTTRYCEMHLIFLKWKKSIESFNVANCC